MKYYALTYLTDMRCRMAKVTEHKTEAEARKRVAATCGDGEEMPNLADGNYHRLVGSVYTAEPRAFKAAMKKAAKAKYTGSIYDDSRTGAAPMTALREVGTRL